MNRPCWYMIAYDIADDKRLKRVHRKLKKEAMAVQKSVFFIKGTERDINFLMDKVALSMNLDEDNLKAYPILEPDKVWTNGTNPLAQGSTISFSSKDSVKFMKKTRAKLNSIKIKLDERILKYFH